MLLQMQVWAFMLLQEAGRAGLGFPPPLGADGDARKGSRYYHVHHVRVVYRRYDRSRYGLQCGAQTEPRICSGRGRRAARRQTRRGHQDR